MAETPEEGKKLFDANKEAFVGLVAYGKMIRTFYNKNGYVENAYGRKYRLKSYNHKMINYVIQGTGATLLKQKLVETHNFLKDYKSRIIHNIHDEIQFEIHKDEPQIVLKLKEIMENTNHKFIVPIVTDIEMTSTNWNNKEEYNEN